MADFARWVSSAEPALPWPEGGFMKVYAQNRAQIIESAIDSDIVGSTLRTWFENAVHSGHWEGSAAELKTLLEEQLDEKVIRSKAWPRDPSRLSIRLRRASGFLRRFGVEIAFHDNRRPRSLSIDKRQPEIGLTGTECRRSDSKPDSTDGKEAFTVGLETQAGQGLVSTDSTDGKKHIFSIYEEGTL
jgi:hypothetical protein